MLYRFNDQGDCVGDTWHESIDAAQTGAANEYGAYVHGWIYLQPEVKDAHRFYKESKPFLRKLDHRVAAAAKYLYRAGLIVSYGRRMGYEPVVYENLDDINREEFDDIVRSALDAADAVFAEPVDGLTEIPWESRCINEARKFALRCASLRASNPYDKPPLEAIIRDLMMELWGFGFSQTEIRTAMEQAVVDMPRYAAGEERRGDKK